MMGEKGIITQLQTQITALLSRMRSVIRYLDALLGSSERRMQAHALKPETLNCSVHKLKPNQSHALAEDTASAIPTRYYWTPLTLGGGLKMPATIA